MGKSRGAKGNKHRHEPYSKALKSSKTKQEKSHKSAPTPPPPQPPPTVPFDSANRILLVGEGDFSFSHSLLNAHGCASLWATCYDSRSVVLEKYPQAASLIKDLEVEDGVKVFYGIDATKLDKAGKDIRKGGFDRVVFNFPHVGGLTKDVNRQVRHNQGMGVLYNPQGPMYIEIFDSGPIELLVGFFRCALSLLAPNGSIVVTIFNGEPYELWNIRDLARHVGLKVNRSFKFQASAYPGYKHARTLGNIKNGGGWRGEDRGARTYVFESKDEEGSLKQKMTRNDEGTDEDD